MKQINALQSYPYEAIYQLVVVSHALVSELELEFEMILLKQAHKRLIHYQIDWH